MLMWGDVEQQRPCRARAVMRANVPMCMNCHEKGPADACRFIGEWSSPTI